jgi:hypothetical protein
MHEEMKPDIPHHLFYFMFINKCHTSIRGITNKTQREISSSHIVCVNVTCCSVENELTLSSSHNVYVNVTCYSVENELTLSSSQNVYVMLHAKQWKKN